MTPGRLVVTALAAVVALGPGGAAGTPQPPTASEHRHPPPPPTASGHRHPPPPETPPHAAGPGVVSPDQPRTPIPPITDADREAAFPDLVTRPMAHGRVNGLFLLDQLEWRGDATHGGPVWDAMGWVGTDRHRLWFRTEGHTESGTVETAEMHALYGRPIARWWDLVLGVRQDVQPGPAQTWAAVGLQGLAPYWFEVELTGYVGQDARTALRAEVEYDLLLTNRIILQPLVEANLHGTASPEHGVGAGLTDTDVGARLRFAIRRELAPYVGLTWHRLYGETGILAEAGGEARSRLRFVFGVRLWR